MSTALPTGSPTVLRSLNRTRILEVVRTRDAISRVDLARETGLSKPTVNEIVAELMKTGMLEEVESSPDARRDRPGPRPKMVAFRPEFGYVVGIDIGGNKLLVFLADLSGRIAASERVAARGPRHAEILLAEVRAAIDRVLDSQGVSIGQLKVVAIATPGVVDPATQRVTLAPQIEGWERVDLAATLRGWFPCRTLIDGEVQLSVLAEQWQGAGRGVDDLVYINVGIGIGAGFLIGGQRYRGFTGAAGEIGYLPLLDGASEAGNPTDGFGAFELAAGGIAYARLGREAAREPRGRVLLDLAAGDPDAVDAEIVYRAGSMGDPEALRIIDLLVERLARGVAAVATLLDPSTVILGGGVSKAGDLLLAPLRHHLQALLPRPTHVVLSSLGEDGAALGAVIAAIREWEADIYTRIGQGSVA